MSLKPKDGGAAVESGAHPKREIFMAGARYEMCSVLMHDGDYMICMTPAGREFIAKPGYGTWCEISLVDLVYRLKRLDDLSARGGQTQ